MMMAAAVWVYYGRCGVHARHTGRVRKGIPFIDLRRSSRRSRDLLTEGMPTSRRAAVYVGTVRVGRISRRLEGGSNPTMA